MTTTRWRAIYDEGDGRLELYRSDRPEPVLTWPARRDLIDAEQALILHAWRNPDQAFRTAPLWDRLGRTALWVTDVWPTRVVLEDR
ncbi:hypothetical protein AB0O47_01910 [Streptomyces noursei]|uniref:hypothetical protein n=1 Tax=Streptomyces noursei TaxID=1971 RepID=UPI0022C56703|nr:hypothetical protein [Streptomyces noursei]